MTRHQLDPHLIDPIKVLATTRVDYVRNSAV